MFTPAHNAKGCLQQAIGTFGNVLVPDYALLQYLQITLGATGWTYLRIGSAPSCEIVRVIQVTPALLVVNRAIDGTVSMPFASGAEISYVATAASVEDQLQLVPGNNVQITVEAPLEIEQLATNQFRLSLPQLNFNSEDNTVVVTGSYPNYNIDVNPQAKGCC